MTTYYHVAPENYNEGEDVLSWTEYVDRYGEDPCAWKWEEESEGLDTDIVCVFRADQRADAEEFASTWIDGPAKLLTIEIDDEAARELRFGVNDEGYTYVMRLIPAEFVVAVETIA